MGLHLLRGLGQMAFNGPRAEKWALLVALRLEELPFKWPWGV